MPRRAGPPVGGRAHRRQRGTADHQRGTADHERGTAAGRLLPARDRHCPRTAVFQPGRHPTGRQRWRRHRGHVLSGQKATTIDGHDGIVGIALSANGGTLYAAARPEHAVIAIDTASLRVTATYRLPAADDPWNVAVQSGKIWVSYDVGDGPSWHAGIGDVDPSAARPAFQNQPAMGGWYSAPEIAADPRNSGALIAAQPGITPATVAS
jgi:hypothetical protein